MSMFALMSQTDILSNPNVSGTNFITDEEIERRNKPNYKFNFSIPKGAKLYLFESNGFFESFREFSSRNEMPNYCVFHTIAVNDKSALKKFTKFKNIQNV